MKHFDKIKEILNEYALENDTAYDGSDEDTMDFIRECGEVIQENFIRKARHWWEYEIIKKYENNNYIAYIDAYTTDDWHPEDKGFEYYKHNFYIVNPTREILEKKQLYEKDRNYN